MAQTILVATDPRRAVLEISGPDAEVFLQGLLTNDVTRAAADRWVYAAMLTPQGKFLADMILDRPSAERFRLDVAAGDAESLGRRLGMYKLRAKVEIAPRPDLSVRVTWSPDGPVEDGAGAADPRDPRLGRRAIVDGDGSEDADAPLSDYDHHRVALGVPTSPDDLRANETFPLEADFERIGGVDFKKGCYVGQEVTARMRHKAELKKALFSLALSAPAAPGDAVLSDGKPAGVLGSVVDGRALAVLRKDRAEDALTVNGAAIDETRLASEN